MSRLLVLAVSLLVACSNALDSGPPENQIKSDVQAYFDTRESFLKKSVTAVRIKEHLTDKNLGTQELTLDVTVTNREFGNDDILELAALYKRYEERWKALRITETLAQQKLWAPRAKVGELILSSDELRAYVAERAKKAGSLDKAGAGARIPENRVISRGRISDSGTVILEGAANVIGADVTIIRKPSMTNGHITWECGVSSPEMMKFVPSSCRTVLMP